MRSSAEIAAAGGKAKAYQADVADFAAVTAMVGDVVKDFGALNILINNAGLAKRQRFVETTPDDWHSQIDACLYGAIHCCHAAAPHLENAKNGRIISRHRRFLARRRVRARDRRGGARRRRRADEVARARVRPLRHDRQRDLARAGRDRPRQGLGRGEPREAGEALSGAPPRARPATSRRWSRCSPRRTAAGSPARCSASAAAISMV